MSTTILTGLFGKDLPDSWAHRVGAAPDAAIEVIVRILPLTVNTGDQALTEEAKAAIQLMDTLGTQAKARGLTPEILENILREIDLVEE